MSEMEIRPCCEKMRQHLAEGTIHIDADGDVICVFGGFLDGTPIHFCPFCSEAIKLQKVQ